MKLLKFILGFVLLLIVIIVLVLGYFGFIPGVSALFGSDKPRDLGVTHTQQDLDSAQTKLEQKPVSSLSSPAPEAKVVDATLTQEEYSAHIEKMHPVSDFQIKLSGSSFEASGKLDKSRIPNFLRAWGVTGVSDDEILEAVNQYLPGDVIFYMAGSGMVKNNDLVLDVSRVELGRLPVSAETARQVVEAYTEAVFKGLPGFSVQDSSIKDGQLYFNGSVPREVPSY